MATTNNIGVIILAAGASSRFGSPKQLLNYAGKTLLQHTVQVAIDSVARPVILVLGANEELIKTTIQNTGVDKVINKEWKEGMASSVRCGIKQLLQIDPLTTGAVIMLCDQPYVNAALVNDLVAAHEKNTKRIVASSYSGTLGAPTFFHKNIFPELLQLKGDVGAKAIIRQHVNDVDVVVFPKGNVDIDTVSDYSGLANNDATFD
jgi:molybdenum cofactor cytidylyltransferase